MHGKTIGYEKNPIMNEEFKLLLKKKKKKQWLKSFKFFFFFFWIKIKLFVYYLKMIIWLFI